MAYFHPATDTIRLPAFESFRDAESYYSTLGHEHVHWTGGEKRLNREFGTRVKETAKYAAEELVAELGAAFLCADLGITLNIREDHASYIDFWLKALKEDKRLIFTAASQAQKAVDYLHGLQPKAEA
jgi:antirestriction protein ArdC